MKTIPLSKGRFALVDDDVFGDLSQFKWYVDGAGYVHRMWMIEGKRHYELMHRRIMRLSPGDMKEVDHVSGDKLDNQRANLRVCTKQQNQRNVGMIRSNKSGFKGVCKRANSDRWSAQIQVNRKQIHLGTFDSPEEAYEAYKEAALKHFGSFANLGEAA
jgi:hypothetical protein